MGVGGGQMDCKGFLLSVTEQTTLFSKFKITASYSVPILETYQLANLRCEHIIASKIVLLKCLFWYIFVENSPELIRESLRIQNFLGEDTQTPPFCCALGATAPQTHTSK